MWTPSPKRKLDNLRNLSGVSAVQARFSAEMDAPDVGEDVSLMVHAYQGAPEINQPVLRTGAALASSDLRGCLIDESFAKANALALGDSIKLTLDNTDRTFVIRGTMLLAEQVVTTKDVYAGPRALRLRYSQLGRFARAAPQRGLP